MASGRGGSPPGRVRASDSTTARALYDKVAAFDGLIAYGLRLGTGQGDARD